MSGIGKALLSIAAATTTVALLAAVPQTPAPGGLAAWSAHPPQTVPIGAGQGATAIAGMLYVYGDADTGIIRELTLGPDSRTTPTGRAIRLTRNGENILPHPTGLTHHPEIGTFIGDTVRQQGVIYHIDWNRALADGNLDNAILNTTIDDLAVNGTRPEFVRAGDRWLIATSDYGSTDNALRLYDPERLKHASRTSAPGVLVASTPCGPFVQTIEWVDEHECLLLVQNITPGLGWRLTSATLDADGVATFDEPQDLATPTDELEGLAIIGDRAVAVSASRRDNVFPVTLTIESPSSR